MEDRMSDAEKITITKCENGWLVETKVDEHVDLKVFEYHEDNHDSQLPALADMLEMIVARIGPYPNAIGYEAAQEIHIKVQDKPPVEDPEEDEDSEEEKSE